MLQQTTALRITDPTLSRFADQKTLPVIVDKNAEFKAKEVKLVEPTLSGNIKKADGWIREKLRPIWKMIVTVMDDIEIFLSHSLGKACTLGLAGGLGGLVIGGAAGAAVAGPVATVTAPAGGLIGFGGGFFAGIMWGSRSGCEAVLEHHRNLHEAKTDNTRHEHEARNHRLALEMMQSMINDDPSLADRFKAKFNQRYKLASA